MLNSVCKKLYTPDLFQSSTFVSLFSEPHQSEPFFVILKEYPTFCRMFNHTE